MCFLIASQIISKAKAGEAKCDHRDETFNSQHTHPPPFINSAVGGLKTEGTNPSVRRANRPPFRITPKVIPMVGIISLTVASCKGYLHKEDKSEKMTIPSKISHLRCSVMPH